MIPELIYGGYLLGQYIYHRVTEVEPGPPKDFIEYPRSEEGEPVPLLFGRYRIQRSIVAWSGGQQRALSGTSPTGNTYKLNVLRAEAIPFYEGTVQFCNAWIGDRDTNGFIPGSPGSAALGFQSVVNTGVGATDPDHTELLCEFGDGRATQDMSTGTFTAGHMNADGITSVNIPGFRGYVTIGMEVLRYTSSLPEISFEIASYPKNPNPYYTGAVSDRILLDANPVDVIAAVLCDQFGKLGRSPAQVIDASSFAVAHQTLKAEGLGYSRCWEARTPGRDIVEDVLRLVDGVLYQEPRTGRYCIKLIRADFVPGDLFSIQPGNCVDVTNASLVGFTDAPNKIQVVYANRSDAYRNATESAQNQANAVGQDGEVNELVLQFLSCTTAENAKKLAARELAARSKPMLRCRAEVDRSAWNVRVGDAVRLTWPDLNCSNLVMRVAAESRSTHNSNTVLLDLIQDYFYVYRGAVVQTVPVAPFPGSGGVFGG